MPSKATNFQDRVEQDSSNPGEKLSDSYRSSFLFFPFLFLFSHLLAPLSDLSRSDHVCTAAQCFCGAFALRLLFLLRPALRRALRCVPPPPFSLPRRPFARFSLPSLLPPLSPPPPDR